MIVLNFKSSIVASLFLLLASMLPALPFQQSIQPLSVLANQQNAFEGHQISAKGAWCWFADARAKHFTNADSSIRNTYIGYIDVHGNIKATQHNFLTGQTNEVLIRSYFQPDDHNNPTFLVLPDERIMIFYSRHTDEACFYYRISTRPGDITSLGEEVRLATSHNTTYPSPFILEDDPTGIYLAWRGINWHPTIARLTLPDANDRVQFTWGPHQIVQSTAARPYAKYFSNGKDKIYMAYTTGHPDNENPNYVYFNTIDVNTKRLQDINGKVLSTVGSGIHNVSATSTYFNANRDAVVDNSSFRNWIWQTAMDKDGNPVMAIVRISADKTLHQYYYAKWTGTEWRKTFLTNAGGRFHQTPGLELCYSGGLAIDDTDPSIVYCSQPITGTHGSVFEIVKYVLDENGTVIATEAVTSNSRLNNSRPFIVENAGNSPLKLTWMHGNYYDWIVSSSRPLGYPTAIHSQYVIPMLTADLMHGRIVNEHFTGSITGTARTDKGVLVVTPTTSANFALPAANSFTIAMTPYLFHGAYEGQIFSMGNISYGIDGNTLKPWLKVGANTYHSTNVFGTSDVWQTQNRGTGGQWYTPTKHRYFNLAITYHNGILSIYRNGLIDQSLDIPGLTLANLSIGGFAGWVEDLYVYDRALEQNEVKELTDISLNYSFDNSLLTDIELAALNIPAEIFTDVLLPSKSSTGATISWTSSNTTVLSAAGLILFPQSPVALTLTATLGTQSRVFQTTVMPRNIAQNKVFIYTFDADDEYTEGGMRFVRDRSGLGNDARIYGSAAINGVLDVRNNTASGFSSNGYAAAPQGLLNSLRSFTFMATLVPSTLTGQPRIFDFGSASSNSIFLRAANYTAGYKYNNGATTLINASSGLTAGQEARVAMTYDARTKTTRVFLNGNQMASSTAIAYEPWQLTTIGANTRNYIGRTQWWDTGVAADNVDYRGTMDNVMLYDIALSAEEIESILNSPPTAINTPSIGAISLYPNPVAAGQPLYLQLAATESHSNLQLTLFNAMGQKVHSVRDARFPLEMQSPETAGLYLLQMSAGNTLLQTLKLQVF